LDNPILSSVDINRFGIGLRIIGALHPDTLITRSDHALLAALTGEIERGIAEFTALLDDQVRVLGSAHPDTCRTRAILPEWEAAE
jgi:hypothetical protein